LRQDILERHEAGANFRLLPLAQPPVRSLAEAAAHGKPRRFGPTSQEYFIHLMLKVQKLEAKLNEGRLGKARKVA
jgi:hypothetical protein